MAATNNKAKTNKVKTPYIKASIDRLTDGNTSLKAYASVQTNRFYHRTL